MKVDLAAICEKAKEANKPVKRTVSWGDQPFETDFFFKKISYREMIEMFSAFEDAGPMDHAAAILSAYVLNEDGDPVFTEDYVNDTLPYDLGQALVDVFNEVNGLGKQD